MTLTGALRFGRYAFPPNRFGYCGSDDHAALLEYVSARQLDNGLVELSRHFDGAYPYLVLIAHANGIADPFDDRVVEAYWIGNDLLDRAAGTGLHELLGERFQRKMPAGEFGWLSTKVDQGARPHHNFHVFEIYVRAGLMRNNKADIMLETMDSCRISWATVTGIAGDHLVVERAALVLDEGRLALGRGRATEVTRQIDGYGFVPGIKVGDRVSVHWQWACEVLTDGALARLRAATNRCLTLANQTM